MRERKRKCFDGSLICPAGCAQCARKQADEKRANKRANDPDNPALEPKDRTEPRRAARRQARYEAEKALKIDGMQYDGDSIVTRLKSKRIIAQNKASLQSQQQQQQQVPSSSG
jgi:hypothetical protein